MTIKSDLLKIISNDIAGCTRCELHSTRTNTVPGEGNVNSKLVWLGEGPGQNEDETGRPFVGRAGKLLDNMIKSVGLKREDTMILNICKCRPPGNRKPTSDEVEACRYYLDMQLLTINPSVIVTLGATATEALLGPGIGITKRRAAIAGVSSITLCDKKIVVIPTLHPSYLLRNPAAKTDAAEDLALIKRHIV